MQSKSSDPTTHGSDPGRRAPRPPRLAAALLRLFTPRDEHEEVLGDLSEEYARHRLPQGHLQARRWYWGQVLRSLRAGLDRPRLPGQRKGDGPMTNLWMDLRYGVRSLLHAPTFTFLTILTLTLAIGVNSAIFSMVNVIFFSDMPMENQDTAVFVWMANPERGVSRSTASIADLVDIREQVGALESAVALTQQPGILSGVDEPSRILLGLMTVDMLTMWGVPPHLGRSFADGEDEAGAPRVALLSHGFWERRFASDPQVVGSEVKVDGYPTTIIGVASPLLEFGDLSPIDLWTPLPLDPTISERDARGLLVTGRLAPGATIEQAQAQLATLAGQLAELHPETNRGWEFQVQDYQTGLADDAFWTIMVLLLITVGLVMLIACSNVATMTLARATGRSQEMAVRAAIGAGRSRIVRQLVTESVLLSLVSGALGLIVARGALFGLTWIVGNNAGLSTFFQMLSIDGRVLLFTLAISVSAPILFGLLPALRSSRSDLAATLKEDGRTSGSAASLRGRRVLVATQVSLAIMLMVVAGLLLRSLVGVRSIAFDHSPETILTMRVDLPEAIYGEMEAVRRFRDDVRDAVESEPGVVRAAWVNQRPLADGVASVALEIAGAELRTEEQTPFAFGLSVSPEYFDIMKLRPVTGRLLTGQDHAESALVAVVNANAAQRFWPDGDPIGQEIRIANGEWRTVVGVASNEVYPSFEEPTIPQLYLPIDQNTRLGAALLVEAVADPLALTPGIRRAVLAIDPDQPVADVRTQARIYADGMAAMDAVASMLATFAVFALVMAGAGIYGVLAFMVAERTHEFGIRMALGASRRSVRTMVMRNSGLLILVGVAVGLLGAVGLAVLLASAIPEVNPTDPLVYVTVGIVLFTVALAAAWIPARRATSVEPVVALKVD